MANNIDLQALGKGISDDYVLNNEPMTGSLKKVAMVHGLNHNQIKRVGEIANVETYLSLMKTADVNNRYINFPVADPDAVLSTMAMPKEASDASDYYRDPMSDVSVADLFAFYNKLEKAAEVWHGTIPYEDRDYVIKSSERTMEILQSKISTSEKIASLRKEGLLKESKLNRHAHPHINGISSTSSSEAGLRKVAQELEAEVLIGRDVLGEEMSSIPEDIISLYKQVKQACLSFEYYPHQVLDIIKTAAPMAYQLSSERVLDQLKLEAPHLNFEKVASNTLINPMSDLYIDASRVENKLRNVAVIEKQLSESEEKYASYVSANKLPNMIPVRNESMSPLIKEARELVLPLAAAMSTGFVMGFVGGKNKGKIDQGVLLQRALLKGTERKNEVSI